MISDPGSRDAQLLYTPTGTPLRLKNKPARLTVRAIRRPEPNIKLLARASLEYYHQYRAKLYDGVCEQPLSANKSSNAETRVERKNWPYTPSRMLV